MTDNQYINACIKKLRSIRFSLKTHSLTIEQFKELIEAFENSNNKGVSKAMKENDANIEFLNSFEENAVKIRAFWTDRIDQIVDHLKEKKNEFCES